VTTGSTASGSGNCYLQWPRRKHHDVHRDWHCQCQWQPQAEGPWPVLVIIQLHRTANNLKLRALRPFVPQCVTGTVRLGLRALVQKVTVTLL